MSTVVKNPATAAWTPVQRYVAAVSAAGMGLLALLFVAGSPHDVLAPQILPLALFASLGELVPIKVPRQGEEDQITTSTTFVFALLLLGGILPAVMAQVVASLLADITHRKPIWKATFNAAQYTLAVTAAGLTLGLFHQLPTVIGKASIAPLDLPALVISAFVLFLGNTTLTGAALAMAQEVPIRDYLRQDLLFQSRTDGVLLALSPIVVVAAENTLFLVPLLLLPIIAVHRSATVSVENIGLVGRLEESLHELRALNQRNEYQALHDGLTDLPNRTLFRERVEAGIAAADRDDRRIAIMIVDLDRFRDINDTLGHHNGDQLLKQVGPRIQETLGQRDVIARLGGDEFGILLVQPVDAPGAEQVARDIQRALEAPFPVGDLQLEIEASVGIARYPEHGRDADTLLRRADLAMYVAKSGGNGVRSYSPQFDHYSPSRLALLGDLRRAIDEGQLVVFYQPKADLKTGRVSGVEALVRWEHPERGLLPPAEFIPFAELTSLIRPLTLSVLDQALEQTQVWRRRGIDLSVAVNLSARNLLDAQLPDEVRRRLERWGVSPERLALEITESTILADPTRAIEVLTHLNHMGVKVSLDDFGTGYSSLSYLRKLPVGEIKIDRSFVMNMIENESDAKIVRSTIDLGRNLGLEVVAEGVETEETWKALSALHCDIAQGYFLSRPMPAEVLPKWLAQFYTARRRPVQARPQPRAVVRRVQPSAVANGNGNGNGNGHGNGSAAEPKPVAEPAAEPAPAPIPS